MYVKLRSKIFALVGMCQTLTRSTKVYVDREGETPALKKWNVGGGGDSRVSRLPSKAAVRRLRQVCVMCMLQVSESML